MEYELAEPKAEALIESLRSVGYSLRTAIADIIDNSIAASAKNIWINFYWEGSKSHVSILDDGAGMNERELSEAMRPGSQSPIEKRSPEDLGRFGLGLKTASFSQARCLSVLSKTGKQQVHVRQWDLDYVVESKEWRLLKSLGQIGDSWTGELNGLKSGTLVLWHNLDRLTGNTRTNSSKARDHFNQQIEEVREHLKMIFHRFLEGPNERLKIWINGSKKQHRLQPWNPFVADHACTSQVAPDDIDFGDEVVSIKGYILPHKDRFKSPEECEKAAGPGGWNAQQGFYIYRNDRMLVSGDWLRLGRPRAWARQEHYRLARISIDIPNSLDSEWSLDVKKSTARPPARIKSKLTKLAEDVRNRAKQVFVHRGEYGPRGTVNQQELTRPWKGVKRGGHTVYRIDRKHVLVSSMLAQVGEARTELETMLRFLEETVPVQRIWLDTAEGEADYSKPYEGMSEDILFEDMKKTWELLTENNTDPAKAKMLINSMEPFNHYPELIEKLK